MVIVVTEAQAAAFFRVSNFNVFLNWHILTWLLQMSYMRRLLIFLPFYACHIYVTSYYNGCDGPDKQQKASWRVFIYFLV